MKTILLVSLVGAISIHSVFAEPGGVHVLTGNEKSIEEIVKADMEKHPDLYTGESFQFYVVKFKQENNIGKRKLAPGDQLTFPETKASIEENKAAELQRLIGTWRTEVKISDRLECHIVEYKDDGTLLGHLTFSETKIDIEYSGKWTIEDEFLKVRVTKTSLPQLFSPRKLEPKKIIQITDDELTTQLKKRGHVVIAKRVK